MRRVKTGKTSTPNFDSITRLTNNPHEGTLGMDTVLPFLHPKPVFLFRLTLRRNGVEPTDVSLETLILLGHITMTQPGFPGPEM